jgi:SPASM domain peptide maturase of grasp-with-spasm system
VKGSKRAVVCDLQRNIIQPVPLAVYEFLNKIQFEKSPDHLFCTFSEADKNTINEYIAFLYHNEFGYYTNSPVSLVEPVFPDYQEQGLITNAIIDFNKDSSHSLEKIVPQLAELGCKAVELRYFYSINLETFEKALKTTSESGLEKIELLVEKNDSIDWEYIAEIKKTYNKLSKVTLSNALDNVIYNFEKLVVIYTTEIIRNETKCGVTGELYCIADSRMFWESQHFNNCLYKKISVDKFGMIKNCPSMQENFGSIEDTTLNSVVSIDAYKKYWFITKDSIEVCCDCELRYVCQDCRAYTIHFNRINSKPLKCRYNPCI